MGDCVGGFVPLIVIISSLTVILPSILLLFHIKELFLGKNKKLYYNIFSIFLLVSLTLGSYFSRNTFTISFFFVLGLVITLFVIFLINIILITQKEDFSKFNKIILVLFTGTLFLIVYSFLLLISLIPSFDSCSGSLWDYAFPLGLTILGLILVLLKK